MRQVVKVRRGFELFNQRMLGVDFQHRLGFGRGLAGLLEHPRQLRAHVVVLHHQARRRIDQARGDAHVGGFVFQRGFEALEQRLEGFGRFFGSFLFALVLQLAQIDRALSDALQRRAIKLLQIVQRPLIDAVGHQQHFNALLLEEFELWAVLGGGQRLGGDVVDGVLAVFHARFVVGKTDAGGVAAGAGKAQELGQTLAVGKVFAQAFFQHRAKGGVELAVFAFFGLVFGIDHVGHGVIASSRLVFVVLGQVFQHSQHALGRAFADGFDVAAFLQQLAADVERQIGRINHAFDKAQVARQQRLGVVHDEDALDVQLDAGLFVAVPQVKRRFGRNVEQLGVFGVALDAVVRPS